MAACAPSPNCFRFERTDDVGLVREILTRPEIYRVSADDGTPKPEDFHVVAHPAVWYVLVFDGLEPLGCFILHPTNSVTWQVHTCLTRDAWGRAEHIARDLVVWVWANTECLRIVTRVPAFNRLALRLSQKTGMLEYGRDVKSFLKNGKLWDEILLGISNPEVS